jgi:hypothetical protein
MASTPLRSLGRELKRADSSEYVAFTGLIIKVLQTAGEMAGQKERFPWFFEVASELSLFLFGLSLVLWLHSSRKQLERLAEVSKRVERLEGKFDDLDLAARYGAGPAYLVNLLRAPKFAHGHAGGETICDVLLRVCLTAAEGLHRLTQGNSEAVTFEDYHLVDKFLMNLMKCLPEGSVWLGVTRLQSVDAWQESTAESSYYRF